MDLFFFFFFQAEDGIRDWSVTGVQTCALPISNIVDEPHGHGQLPFQRFRRELPRYLRRSVVPGFESLAGCAELRNLHTFGERDCCQNGEVRLEPPLWPGPRPKKGST